MNLQYWINWKDKIPMSIKLIIQKGNIKQL